MPGIQVRIGEGIEAAIRRFKRVVEKSGILSEFRKKETHETPSEQKKRARAAAVKRHRKKQMRDVRGPRGSAPGRGRTPTAGAGRSSNSSNRSSFSGAGRDRDRD